MNNNNSNILKFSFLGSVVEAEVLKSKTVYRRVGGDYYVEWAGALHSSESQFLTNNQIKIFDKLKNHYNHYILNDQDPGIKFVALAEVVAAIDGQEREENERKAQLLKYVQEDDFL